MKVYRRYMTREVSAAVLLVLLAFLALFAFFDLLGEIKSVGESGYQLHHALGFVLLRVPGRAYELMPIAVLIGTLYALSGLARHSEITVLRASGLSTGALLGGLFQVAGLFALATYLTGEFVAPPAERAAYQLRSRERGGIVGQDLRSGLWVKDEQSFVNVRIVLPDAGLRGVRIYQFDEKGQLRSVTEAAQGTYVLPDSWRLSDVLQTMVRAEGVEIRRMPELLWRSALNPDILAVLLVSPDRMSMWHLAAYTKHLADNHQQTNARHLLRARAKGPEGLLDHDRPRLGAQGRRRHEPAARPHAQGRRPAGARGQAGARSQPRAQPGEKARRLGAFP